MVGLIKPFVAGFVDVIIEPTLELEPVDLRCIADEPEVEIFWFNITILVLDPLVEII